MDIDAIKDSVSYKGSRGIKVRHRIEVLDLSDEITNETLPVVANSGSVTWTYRPSESSSGSSVIVSTRRRASLELAGDLSINLLARRVRFRSDFQASEEYGGVWVPWYFGVFTPQLPPLDDPGDGPVRMKLDLADKTARWNQVTTNEPINISESENIFDAIALDLGQQFGETTFNYSAPALTSVGEPMLIEAGVSYLEKWTRMLRAVGFDQIIANEEGEPTTHSFESINQRAAEEKFGPGERKIMTAGTKTPLLPSLPNVLKFVAQRGPTLPEVGNGITYRYNFSTGPGSINERGERVQEEVTVEAINQTNLEQTANSEAQRYFAGGGDSFSGNVGLFPRFSDRDVISLVKPRLGITQSDDWNITSWMNQFHQDITGSAGILMPISAERRVNIT